MTPMTYSELFNEYRYTLCDTDCQHCIGSKATIPSNCDRFNRHVDTGKKIMAIMSKLDELKAAGKM